MQVWQAAERLAGCVLPAPFWAFPWPAGIALARTLHDDPSIVRGRAVIDVGTGGGVSSFGAARAGARRVVAMDIDPWALAVTRLGAMRQDVHVETHEGDITRTPDVLDGFAVILCADMAYDRSSAAAERAAIQRAVARGATALLADAGRTYFETTGLELMAELTIDVVADLEGTDRKLTRVWRMRPPA